MLKRGQRLRTTRSGFDCVVEDRLGQGGQGAVYSAVVDDMPVALKWYYPQWHAVDVGLRRRLEVILDSNRPSDRFLWPIDMVVGAGTDDFGYIMPLRTPAYDSMTALLAGRSTASFRAVTTVAYELADSFHRLHAEGLSYQDISEKNFWFHPDTGAIEICDADNVSVNGVPSAVAGTPDYMAPEIVLGRAPPTADTDRYSLAVLIFQLLVIDHPLRGARDLKYPVLDEHACTEIYGAHPVFVFDPDDDSNRPVPGLQDGVLRYWPLYPGFMHELFVQSFTVGLRSPGQRVWESEWRRRLVRLRDAILLCDVCGVQNFYDERRGDAGRCWNCGAAMLEPLRLAIGADSVVLNTDTQLFDHHLNPYARFTFGGALASVTRHPVRLDRFGLRNDSESAWTVTVPGGSPATVEPRHVVPLKIGTRIDFGARQGEVVGRTAAAAVH